MGIKGRGRSGRSRDSNPACQCCSSAHLVQCEPDEASGFTNPNVGPGTYASLRLKLDAWSSAVQRGQKCSPPTRRLPSRSWGPIRPRVCSWFRAPIRHECQTAQLFPYFAKAYFFFFTFSLLTLFLVVFNSVSPLGDCSRFCPSRRAQVTCSRLLRPDFSLYLRPLYIRVQAVLRITHNFLIILNL